MVRVHLPIWFEPESFGCRDTGSFILINPETNDTIALGIIEVIEPAPSGAQRQVSFISSDRPRPMHALSQKPLAGGLPEASTSGVDHRECKAGQRRRPCQDLDQDLALLRSRARLGAGPLGAALNLCERFMYRRLPGRSDGAPGNAQPNRDLKGFVSGDSRARKVSGAQNLPIAIDRSRL